MDVLSDCSIWLPYLKRGERIPSHRSPPALGESVAFARTVGEWEGKKSVTRGWRYFTPTAGARRAKASRVQILE